MGVWRWIEVWWIDGTLKSKIKDQMQNDRLKIKNEKIAREKREMTRKIIVQHSAGGLRYACRGEGPSPTFSVLTFYISNLFFLF